MGRERRWEGKGGGREKEVGGGRERSRRGHKNQDRATYAERGVPCLLAMVKAWGNSVVRSCPSFNVPCVHSVWPNGGTPSLGTPSWSLSRRLTWGRCARGVNREEGEGGGGRRGGGGREEGEGGEEGEGERRGRERGGGGREEGEGERRGREGRVGERRGGETKQEGI